MKKTKLITAITAAVISMATITSCSTADIEAIPKSGTYRPIKSIGYYSLPASKRDNCKVVIDLDEGRIYSWSVDSEGKYFYDEICCELGEWERFEGSNDWYWRAQIKTYVKTGDGIDVLYPNRTRFFGYALSDKTGKKIHFLHTTFKYNNSNTKFEADK